MTKIDSIEGHKKAQDFIHSFGKNHQSFRLVTEQALEKVFSEEGPCKELASLAGLTKPYFKVDLDRNGLTDLLAFGNSYASYSKVIFTHSADSFDVRPLYFYSQNGCVFPVVNEFGEIKVFAKERKRDTNQQTKKTTLTFKFESFIEANPSPSNYSIEKIEFETTPCFGVCPIFKLSIVPEGLSIFLADAYNFDETNWPEEGEGTFKALINPENWEEMVEILNYIDFPELSDSYSVGWTDDQACTLRVYYNNGKKKEIYDYGLMGTYGLMSLYPKLFQLRRNQDWVKI